MSEWSVVCSGTGTVVGPFNRGAPSTVVRFGETQILVDCGDGTLRQLARASALRRFDAILLTATAAEQIVGLLALIDYLRRIPLGSPVRVYGPAGTKTRIESLIQLQPELSEALVADEPQAGTAFLNERGIYVEPIALERHPEEPGYGYIFFEDPLPGRLDPDRAAQRGLRGPELGRVQSGETVRGVSPRDVMGPPRPGRRLVIAGRCRPSAALEDALRGADVAVLPAPYLDERLEVAQASFTMTGWEAAEMSKRSNTRFVVLHQLAVQTPIAAQRMEARQFHPTVVLPSDGDIVVIPIPDNGPPRLEQHGNRDNPSRPTKQPRRR